MKVILVNDGSSQDISEGKEEIIKALGAECFWVEYAENKGKGYALREGVKHSQADCIMITDHDIPYTYGSMIEMYENLEFHPVVIGHRDEDYYKDLPFLRVKISHYLKTINSFILRLNTDDTQCGLKVFRKSVKPIFLKTETNRFLIDIEFLRRLKKAKIPALVLDVKSRENVEMSTLGIRTIFSELISYAKIFLKT